MNGDRIVALRQRLGWSQQVLADRLGVASRSVVRWEQGVEPTPRTKSALVALENISKWSEEARVGVVALAEGGVVSGAVRRELGHYGAIRNDGLTFEGSYCANLLRGEALVISAVHHWKARGGNRIKAFSSGSAAGNERMRPEVTVVFCRGDEELYNDQLHSLADLDRLAEELEEAGIDATALRNRRRSFKRMLAGREQLADD